jgi:hypothetical protein
MSTRDGCRVSGLLSEPPKARRQARLSVHSEDPVYANRLAFCLRAIVPSVLHATASSPDTPPGLPRLLVSPANMSVA